MGDKEATIDDVANYVRCTLFHLSMQADYVEESATYVLVKRGGRAFLILEMHSRGPLSSSLL
jgi:hypothetical protein